MRDGTRHPSDRCQSFRVEEILLSTAQFYAHAFECPAQLPYLRRSALAQLILEVSLRECASAAYERLQRLRNRTRDRDEHARAYKQGKERESQYPSIDSAYKLSSLIERLENNEMWSGVRSIGDTRSRQIDRR